MICMCGSCIHAETCYGDNDDYSEDGGLCVHYRNRNAKRIPFSFDFLKSSDQANKEVEK